MKQNGIHKDTPYAFDSDCSIIAYDDCSQEKLVILAEWAMITNRGTKGNRSYKARRQRKKRMINRLLK